MTRASPQTGLIKYDAMVNAIAAAYEVDEVKDIRDKAKAAETYFAQAKNFEAERRAVEIRLRAERRAGQMLAAMEKAKAAPGNQHTGPVDRCREGIGPKTLGELGISKKQSSAWQRMADIPEDEFEATLGGPEKPTTAGLAKTATAAGSPFPAAPPVDRDVLWVWGTLEDFERHNIFDKSFADVFERSAPHMRESLTRLAAKVTAWLEGRD